MGAGTEGGEGEGGGGWCRGSEGEERGVDGEAGGEEGRRAGRGQEVGKGHKRERCMRMHAGIVVEL